jgi:hypothetical protein
MVQNESGMKKETPYYARTAAAKVKYLSAHYPCVLVQDGTIYPMEIKRSFNPVAADLRHAARIPAGAFVLHPGIVLCTAE